MHVTEHEVGDADRLEGLVGQEPGGKQRDRYRMALLALRGWEAVEIAEALSSNRRTVQAWVRYRGGGVAALVPVKGKGHRPMLAPEKSAAFIARMTARPRDGDGVCTLRARDAQRILCGGRAQDRIQLGPAGPACEHRDDERVPGGCSPMRLTRAIWSCSSWTRRGGTRRGS